MPNQSNQIEQLALEKFSAVDFAARGIGVEDHLALIDSIRAVGLLQPLGVLRAGDAFKVCSGFRRLLACRELALPSVACSVVDDAPETSALRFLAENFPQRRLNFFELFYCLRALEQDKRSLSAGLERYFPQLVEGPKNKILPKLRRIEGIAVGARPILSKQGVPLETLSLVADWPAEQQLKVAAYWQVAAASAQDIRETSEYLHQLQITDRDGFFAVIADAMNLQAATPMVQLKKNLFAKTFPAANAEKEKEKTLLERVKKDLRQLQLKPLTGSESGVEIRGRLTNCKEVEQAKGELDQLAQSDAIRRILEGNGG